MFASMSPRQLLFHTFEPGIRLLLVTVILIASVFYVGTGLLNRPTNSNLPGNAPCAPDAIRISIVYTPLTDPYMPQVMDTFNQSYFNGRNPLSSNLLGPGERSICITGKERESGTVMQAIVNAVI